MWSKQIPLKKILISYLPFLIILFGAFLRFWKLDWGEGYFFHPDEYHIGAAVGRLQFPRQMNPHFFNYGSLITYTIYFTKLIFPKLNTLNSIFIGRFYSAFYSTLTLGVIFLISKKVFREKLGILLSLGLAAITPGLIQQAHFATPESSLIFWLFLTLYLAMLWLEKRKFGFLCLAAISLGLGLSTKIVAIVFLPILYIPSAINLFYFFPKKTFKSLKNFPKILLYLIKVTSAPIILLTLIFFLTSPYVFLDYKEFRSAFNWETRLGMGNPIVFYTRQFINTKPILFQSEKIFPYVLGVPLFVLGVIGLFLLLFNFKEKNYQTKLLIVLSFLFYFFPHAFLFAKWTRFVAPTFPFFALFASYAITKIKNKLFLLTVYCLLLTNLFWSLTFFSLYLHHDIRINVTNWINDNLPKEAVVFTEQGNMIEVPIWGNTKRLSLDFYSLEENRETQNLLPEYLMQADFFIVQSRRLFFNHQRLSEQFPKTARFYDLLFSNQLGFEKIKEFSPWPFTLSDELAEETWTVFDHPVIRIYKKTELLPSQTYENFLKI